MLCPTWPYWLLPIGQENPLHARRKVQGLLSGRRKLRAEAGVLAPLREIRTKIFIAIETEYAIKSDHSTSRRLNKKLIQKNMGYRVAEALQFPLLVQELLARK
jgi:hypothetical protein